MKKYKEIKEDLIDDYCESCNLYEDLEITEAEYKGKTVKLNDPIRTSENKNKKFKVYTMGPINQKRRSSSEKIFPCQT